MLDIQNEVFSIKFLVINVILGTVLSIVANLATMYVHDSIKSMLVWFREYGIMVGSVLFIFGVILLVGISIGINEYGLPKSWYLLARIGLAAAGLSMIALSFINEYDETWGEMSIFAKLYLIGRFVVGCMFLSGSVVG